MRPARVRLASRFLLAGTLVVACTAAPTPALDGRAVDEGRPTFTSPTDVTNPLFPAATVAQLVHLGIDGGQPLRVEVTRMPKTRIVEWDGVEVETVVVQFISYRNDRILEVAYDFFAQADDGSVWYFGETVDNYADGRVSNHSGAWLAGEDGPPGMIMPADPRVGDIYHPENIPGVVFEELIVLATDVSLPGPAGEITGAIRVEEHLMEGTVEQKIFAPGYGEFEADAPSELVTVAVAVPTDALAAPMPDAMVELHTASVSMADGDPDAMAEPKPVLDTIDARWTSLRGDSPPLLVEAVDAAVASLEAAVDGGDARAIRSAGVALLMATLDLELRYRGQAAVDLDRIGAWMRHLVLAADEGDEAGVVSDAAIGAVIWARTADAADAAGRERIGPLLASLAEAASAADAAAARAIAEEIAAATSARAR